jgi:hypothetical protein
MKEKTIIQDLMMEAEIFITNYEKNYAMYGNIIHSLFVDALV